MKILVQQWHISGRGQITSISKDRQQLDVAIEDIRLKSASGEMEPTKIDGTPREVEIEDDSIFAEMVTSETVFLHDDEMDIIYDAINAQDSK